MLLLGKQDQLNQHQLDTNQPTPQCRQSGLDFLHSTQLHPQHQKRAHSNPSRFNATGLEKPLKAMSILLYNPQTKMKTTRTNLHQHDDQQQTQQAGFNSHSVLDRRSGKLLTKS